MAPAHVETKALLDPALSQAWSRTGSHSSPASVLATAPWCLSPSPSPASPPLRVVKNLSPLGPPSPLCNQDPERLSEKVECDSPQQEMRYQSVRSDTGNRLVAEAPKPTTAHASGRQRKGPEASKARTGAAWGTAGEYLPKDKALTGHLATDRQPARGQRRSRQAHGSGLDLTGAATRESPSAVTASNPGWPCSV